MFVQFTVRSNSTTDFRQFKLSSADERTLWDGYGRRDLLSPVNYYRESRTSPLGCNLPGI